VLYSASQLGAGNHTLTITNDPAAVGNIIDVDYALVMGGSVPSGSAYTGALSSSSSTSKKSDVGAIAGAVIGVIIAFAIAAILILVFYRRRKNSRESLDIDHDKFGDQGEFGIATPYTGVGHSAHPEEFNPNAMTISPASPSGRPAEAYPEITQQVPGGHQSQPSIGSPGPSSPSAGVTAASISALGAEKSSFLGQTVANNSSSASISRLTSPGVESARNFGEAPPSYS